MGLGAVLGQPGNRVPASGPCEPLSTKATTNMRHLRPALVLTLLVAGACTTTRSRSVGGLDLVLVARAPESEAAPIHFEGRGYVQTGEGWHAELSELTRTFDGAGKPAIRFSLVPSDAENLASWSEANIGKHLALCVDNQVLTVAMIDDRLSGTGLITLRGNDPVRVDRWIALIASN